MIMAPRRTPRSLAGTSAARFVSLGFDLEAAEKRRLEAWIRGLEANRAARSRRSALPLGLRSGEGRVPASASPRRLSSDIAVASS